MGPARVVVVGSVNLDCTVYVPRLPNPGETMLGGEMCTAVGGKGANQAVAAHRLGAEVSFIAKVGKDENGRQCLELFKSEELDDTHVVQLDDCATGFACLLVDSAGENLIAVASGANGLLSPKDIERASAQFAGAAVLLMQHEVPVEANLKAAELAKANGAKIVLNAAPAQRIERDLLAALDVLIVNEAEARVLAGDGVTSDLREVAEMLTRQIPLVLLTLGADGAWVADSSGVIPVSPLPVDAVDTVGAGDTFSGAFAAAYGANVPVLEAVQLASAAAAISVTRRGAIPSIPRLAEVNELLAARIRR